MKVWLRYFKTVPDVVCAETEEEAQQMDCSDACDTVDVDYVRELDASFLERSHPSWREYLPNGDPEYRTLAEIFGLAPSPNDSANHGVPAHCGAGGNADAQQGGAPSVPDSPAEPTK